jgi:hypothetical protein
MLCLPQDAKLIYEGDTLLYKTEYKDKEVALKYILYSDREDAVAIEAELTAKASEYIKHT